MPVIAKVVRIGEFQAVEIPPEMAFQNIDEVEIEQVGEELRVRPVHPRRSLAGALDHFAAFPPDFMQDRFGPAQEDQSNAGVRRLEPAELEALRQDMHEAHAWATSELRKGKGK